MVHGVTHREREIVIRVDNVELRVLVGKADADTPSILGHLYRVQTGFVPVRTYVFEVTGTQDIDVAKKAVDFFFASLLDTEWYVKEVPRDSLFYQQEALRLYGKVTNGTVYLVR